MPGGILRNRSLSLVGSLAEESFANYFCDKLFLGVDGFDTKYAHMQNIYVKPGQEVKQGDVIGTMGNSGLSDGPHLHYEVRIGSQVLDPAKFINMTDNAYENIKWTIQEYK